MNITLRPVNHSGPRKNRYCGPSALSALTGLSTGDTAALLRKVSGKRSIKGTHTRHMKVALEWLGYRTGCDFDYEHLPARGRPTLLRWAKGRPDKSATYLLSVGHHWAVVQGRRYVCGIIGSIVPIKESPKKRAKVKAAWRITRHIEVNLKSVIPPAPVRPPDVYRSDRQQAKALAAKWGIDLDIGTPSPDCIWVSPPTPLCDEDGEMPGDPYHDEHYHYDYQSAKEAIETYAKLVEANTPEVSRDVTLVETISLVNQPQPVTV